MNSFDQVNPALLDVQSPATRDGHHGYTRAHEAADTIDALRSCCGAATRDFPKELWIEPKDWKEKAAENDKNKTWAMNYIDRFTNQNPTHECTCHSLRANFEAARNRQRAIIFAEGPKVDFRYDTSTKGSVWVSPNSVYAEANPRQWGGAGIIQVLEIAVRRGMLPEKIQPHEYGFKHAVNGTTGKGGKNQSSGPWLSVSKFPEGWQETAKLFVPLEVIIPESYEQAVCLLLHGRVVSVGRSGHAVPWSMWMASNGSAAYPDSYDVIRYDSAGTVRSAWSGSFSIATVTTPDDWSKPQGDA
jgi:hypothetical protein